jgi:hypothetical protein
MFPFGSRRAARAATALALFGLYAVGVLHWWLFFGGGHLSLRAYDWPKERMYLQLLQASFREGRLPYHVQVPVRYAQEFKQLINYPGPDPDELPKNGPPVTCRFLALPETVLSPQVLLLPCLTVGGFILFHNLFLYSMGFLGCLWIRRRYRLSLVPFAALFVLFNFNGYITAHLGVGHSMWGGYFLLPWFGLFILEWLEEASGLLSSGKLAFVHFAMLLQGSFHLVTWCWILVGLIGLCNPRLWKGSVIALGGSALLAAFRLVPAAVAFSNFRKLPFSIGYPTLTDLLDGLTVMRGPRQPWPTGVEWQVYWWEYDVFIGILGLAMLAYFGVYRRFAKEPTHPPCQYAALDLPLLFVFLMSINYFYFPIFKLPIPLLNGERVTSRFIVIPVFMLAVLAAIRMQRMLEVMSPSGRRTLLFAAAIVTTFFSLMTHSSLWAVPVLERKEGTTWHLLETAVRIDQPDPWYQVSVHLSAGLSLLCLFGWACWVMGQGRRPRAEDLAKGGN